MPQPFQSGRSAPHFCSYRRLKSHLSRESFKWVERCRCGNSVLVDCNFFVADCKSPKQKRTWFDRNGNVTRVTGNKTENENVENTARIPPDNSKLALDDEQSTTPPQNPTV